MNVFDSIRIVSTICFLGLAAALWLYSTRVAIYNEQIPVDAWLRGLVQ